MVLQSEEQWANQLQDSGTPTTDATRDTKIFHKNHFTNETFLDLTKSDLIDLGITILGDIKIILCLNCHKKIQSNCTPITLQLTSHI